MSIKKAELEKLNKVSRELAEGYYVDNDYKAAAFLTFYKKGPTVFMEAWHVDYDAIQFEGAAEGTTLTIEAVELHKYRVEDLIENPDDKIKRSLELYFTKK